MIQERSKAVRRASSKIETKSFGGASASIDPPKIRSVEREDSDGQVDDKKIKTDTSGKDSAGEYKDFIYSVFTLCYSVVTGTDQEGSKDQRIEVTNE
jgi:hypothetical protein